MGQGLGAGAAVAAVAALLAAGCVAAPAPTPLADRAIPPPEQTFTDAHDGCDGYLLAVLVDPVRTDGYLPPGFHLRDAREFLGGVSTGQALLLVAAVLCAPTVAQPQWSDATAALFVQPPSVPGERPPADYDVYELEHYGPEPAVQARLAAWRWPVVNATLAEDTPVREARSAAFGFVAGGGPVTMPGAPLPGDALLRFGGPTPAPALLLPTGSALVRLWRDTPAGLAHVDDTLRLPLSFGSGYCTFGAESVLARLTGETACHAPTGAGWQPDGNAVATFGTSLRSTAVLQPGVHAQ